LFTKILLRLLILVFLSVIVIPLELSAQNVNLFPEESDRNANAAILYPSMPLQAPGVELDDPWIEFELNLLDTLFNIVNSGIKRMYYELNGRRFIFTTFSAEVTRGDYIFLIPEQDTVLIDISRYIKPGLLDTTYLRVLSQGPAGTSALIFIGDESAKFKEQVDFVLELDSRKDGDANGDGYTHEREDQFVELVNTGNETVDISGWRITVNAIPWHRFSGGTLIEPARFIVVFGGGVPKTIPGQTYIANPPGSNPTNGLESKTGRIELRDISGQIVDSLSYTFPNDVCQSLTRNPDGTGEFTFHLNAINSGRALYSPGRTAGGDTSLLNGTTTAGRMTINEVYTNPAADDPLFPPEIQLLQNYPNPFNNETVIRFTVPESYPFSAEVRLTIFNSLGQKIITLASGRYFPGTIECRWNGRNKRGDLVASGFYVAQLIIEKQQKTHRLILLR
jgi:hypothetical protein